MGDCEDTVDNVVPELIVDWVIKVESSEWVVTEVSKDSDTALVCSESDAAGIFELAGTVVSALRFKGKKMLPETLKLDHSLVSKRNRFA